MAQYWIVCVNKQSSGPLLDHTHIVGVGTGDSTGYNSYWTVDQIVQSIWNGNVFYTVSPSTGAVAIVEVVHCPRCNRYFIRSHPDAVTDNNLDNLGACRR